MTDTACPLCTDDGGTLVFRNAQLRVIQADEPGFPAFYRVIWNRHVAEFSDLTADERAACMDAVAGVEQVLRAELRPCKINLAALGNRVPHLHWHVVARFDWDSHYPAPIWSPSTRPLDNVRLDDVRAHTLQVHRRIQQQCEQKL